LTIVKGEIERIDMDDIALMRGGAKFVGIGRKKGCHTL
jgi:hypothetical protein